LTGARDDGLTAEQFAEWYDELLRLANVVAPPGIDGADVLHDALASCLGRFRRRGPVADAKAYLARAIINEARARRRQWRRRARVDVTERVPNRSPFDELNGQDASVALLDGLPPRQRACLYLRFIEDRSVEETADLLGCTTGTVKSQTAKALAHLRLDARTEVTE
jgi:RNA polymerase sigma factor (sigma-70 family)